MKNEVLGRIEHIAIGFTLSLSPRLSTCLLPLNLPSSYTQSVLIVNESNSYVRREVNAREFSEW